MCPVAEFIDASGATEILNTASTHDGEADVVNSEVIVQRKDQIKCIWTHELLFPLFFFFLLCVFPWSSEPVSFSQCMLLLFFAC